MIVGSYLWKKCEKLVHTMVAAVAGLYIGTNPGPNLISPYQENCRNAVTIYMVYLSLVESGTAFIHKSIRDLVDWEWLLIIARLSDNFYHIVQ